MSRRPNLEARERIVCAALELFHDKGYRGTSMDDVAAAVTMKKANVFHYYPTKDDLGMAVICHAAEARKSKLQKHLAGAKDPVQAVKRLFDVMAAEMRERDCRRGELMANLAQEISDYNERLRIKVNESLRFWISELAQLFRQSRAKRFFVSTMKPDEAAEAIMSLLEGAVLMAKANRQIQPIHSARKMAVCYLRQFKNSD